jgi:hypothetical protein
MSVFGYNFLWEVRGPKFDEVGADGIRRIGYRAGKDVFVQTGTHPGGGKTPAGTPLGVSFQGAPEILLWTIRPDGSATYSNPWTYSIGKEVNMCRFRDGTCRVPPFDTYKNLDLVAKTSEVNRGSPGYTYNFSPESLNVFRMAASLFPNGVIERGISINGLQWPAWDFPFTATDSAKMREWVTSLSAADAFGMYYSLLAYDGPDNGTCKWRKFMQGISPGEFEGNYFWAVFQEMVLRSIYDIRTDLHKVRDPDTGAVIDGLIKYDNFAMPCKPGIGEIIFQVVASVALGVVTAGAGAALATALKTIDIAKTIYEMKASADKQKAAAAFTNSVVKGYTSGTDIQNILQPPPKLTPEEQKLIERASGETKSPTETNVVVGGAVGSSGVSTAGSGIPWLLIAGAAAALLG